MSLRKNISGGPLDVPLLDRVVEDGETVEVPDFQPAHDPQAREGDPGWLAIVWSADKWEAADVPAVKPEKAAKPDTSGKAAG